MLLGRMMQMPLAISSLIEHADRWHGDTEIVSRRVEGDIHRYTYRDLDARAQAQHVAEVGGRQALQFLARDQFDARKRPARRNFGARRGDDDGFDRMGAGDGRQQNEGVQACSSRAVNRRFTGRGRDPGGRAASPHPRSPAATGAC